MTTQMSDAAASARETARTAGGKFGTQPATEADVDLEHSPVFDLKRSAPYYDLNGTTSVRYDSTGFPEGVSHAEVRFKDGATHLSVMRELDAARIAPAGVEDPKEWVDVRSDEIQQLIADRAGTDDAQLSRWRGRTTMEHRTVLDGGEPGPETISDRVNATADGKLEDYLSERLAANVEPDTAAGAAVAQRIGINGVEEAQHEALGRIERLHGPVKQMGASSMAQVLEVEFISKQHRDQEVSVHLTPEGEYRRSWIGEYRRGNPSRVTLRDIAPRAWPMRW